MNKEMNELINLCGLTEHYKLSIMKIWKETLKRKFELMYEDGMSLSFIESEIEHIICSSYDEKLISADVLVELRKYLTYLINQ